MSLAAADEREWNTKKQAAAKLGVTVRTIDRMIEKKILTAGGTPGLVLIHDDDLEAAVRGRQRRRRHP